MKRRRKKIAIWGFISAGIAAAFTAAFGVLAVAKAMQELEQSID